MKPSIILQQKRQDVQDIFAKYPLISNPRVFGSVCRSKDTEDSDIDFLVKVQEGVGLLMLSRLHNELHDLLGKDIDLLTEAQLPPKSKDLILEEAIAL